VTGSDYYVRIKIFEFVDRKYNLVKFEEVIMEKNEIEYNILFVNPPSIPYVHLEKCLENKSSPISQVIAMPMGILYLASMLEKDLPNCNIRILDLAKKVREYGSSENRIDINLDDYIDFEIKNFTKDGFTPDFVGISVLFSTAHKTTGQISNSLKNFWPNSPIIVGGMHATNAVEELLEFNSIDYVCRGEAESIISHFAQGIRNNDDLEKIPGIIGRKKLVQNPVSRSLDSAPLINDLDEIPHPAWHLLPMLEYVGFDGRARNMDEIAHDKAATIVTTRGCPFLCTFCASWTVHGRKMRVRSKENVIEELHILHEKYGVTVIVPEDDLFTVQPGRIIELCNAIANEFEGKLEFQFPNGLSVATLSDPVIEAFMGLGATLVNIAIESGSHRVQREVIKKNCNLNKAVHVVNAFREAGTIVRTYFILGFPGETRDEMLETLDFAHDLPSDWSNFGIAAPLIGTEMYDQLIERGNIDQSFNWDSAFFQERSFDTEAISAKELKNLVGLANLRINFFDNYNLRIGDYDRAITLFKEVFANYPDHLAGAYCISLAYERMGDGEQSEVWKNKCFDILNSDNNGMAIRHLHTIGEEFPEEFLDVFKIAKPEIRPIRSFWEPENTTGEDNFFF